MIINNTRYEVEKELFEKVEVGDQVEMLYTGIGESLIKIVSKKDISSCR